MPYVPHCALVLDQRKSTVEKPACRMLMKMSTGINFINVLRAAFAQADPETSKKTDNLIDFLCFWDFRA